MFIKKSVFSKVGLYSEDLIICSDWKFQLDSICKFKCTYKHFNQIVSDFLGGGISSKLENQNLVRKEKESVLIKEYACFREDLLLFDEYKTLFFYYRNSKRIKWLKKLKILRNI